MRVQLIERWATAEFNLGPGTVVDVPPAAAALMVGARHAEAIDPFPVPAFPETSDEPPVEPTPPAVEAEVATEPAPELPVEPTKPRGRRGPKPTTDTPEPDPTATAEGE